MWYRHGFRRDKRGFPDTGPSSLLSSLYGIVAAAEEVEDPKYWLCGFVFLGIKHVQPTSHALSRETVSVQIMPDCRMYIYAQLVE